VAFAFLSALAAASAVSYSGYQVYQVSIENGKQAQFMDALGNTIEMDIWSGHVVAGSKIEVMVAPEVADKFTAAMRSMGIVFSVTVNDVQTMVDAFPIRQRDSGGDAGQADHGMTWDEYHSLETMYEYLDFLEASNVDVTTETIGQSYEGHDMRVVKICRGECGKKPAMYIQGGIHAREWISPAVVMYFVRELTERVTDHEDLLEQLDWYILPVTNPDGYAYTQIDRLWRKTRSPNANSVCVGTDANRNFDVDFGGAGARAHPCSTANPGKEAFSEI
jgi:murein tripeptide amidase MpaA